MANKDAANGFQIMGRIGGGSLRLRKYKLAAANTVIGKNMLVQMTNAGTVDIGATSMATTLLGVAAHYCAASKGGTSDPYILVYDQPDLVMHAQSDDGTGTGTAQTAIGLNAEIVVGSYDSYTYVSTGEIDEDSVANTSTLPLKLIGLYPDPKNAFGEFNRLIFTFNHHMYKSVGVQGI